jgi:putative transcriptional regulator
MDDNLFNDLIGSVKEAGQIKRGKVKASRRFIYNTPDVKKIRKKIGLTQDKFAVMMGIPLSTYQKWEQGSRKPTGAAVALLTIFDRDPEHAIKALSC